MDLSCRKSQIIFLAAIIVMLAIFLSRTNINPPNPTNHQNDRGSTSIINVGAFVEINGIRIGVELVDTPEKRALGLSGRERLEENAGMLFVFDEPGIYPFWMKDMLFPIDIIWIDKDMRIAGMTENAAPESYPKLFNPPSPVLYVLEMPAGFIQNNAVTVDMSVISSVVI